MWILKMMKCILFYTFFFFAFHPKLHCDRITVKRSFGHFLQQLYDVSHLPRDMLSLIGPITKRRLKDGTIGVSQRKIKQSISKMFTTEMKLVYNCL